MQKCDEFSFILKPSGNLGIGVFATYDIKKGSQLFDIETSYRKLSIKNIPKEFQKYCVFLNDEECICPERFDRMEIGWFINHSSTPNCTKNTNNKIISIKDIRAGEEVFIDYNELNEPEHLKEPYYR